MIFGKIEPRECKWCIDGLHCDKRKELEGEYTWVHPCHVLDFPCPDFTPKNKEE